MEYATTTISNSCSGKSEAERVAIFMGMIGKDGQEIKDTFEFERAEDGRISSLRRFCSKSLKVIAVIANPEGILSSTAAIVSLRETNSMASP